MVVLGFHRLTKYRFAKREKKSSGRLSIKTGLRLQGWLAKSTKQNRHGYTGIFWSLIKTNGFFITK